MKHFKTKLSFCLAVLLICAVALTACGTGGTPAATTSASTTPSASASASASANTSASASTSSAAKPVVKIGVVMPMSGTSAWVGEETANAVKLLVEQTNALPDYPVKLEVVTMDDQGKPTESLSAVTRLIESEGVSCIIGPWTSACATAVQEYINQKKIPLITAGAASDALSQKGFEYYFRVTGNNSMQAKFGVKWINKKWGWKNVVVIAQNTDWGTGLVQVTQDTCKEVGINILSVEKYELNATDYYSLLTRLKGVKYDGLIMCSNIEELANFTKQANELGVAIDKLFAYGTDAYKLLELNGAIVNGYTYNVNMDLINPPDDLGKAFVTSYKAKYKDPSMYAAQGWVVTQAFVDAIKRAATKDGPGIQAALKSTKDLPSIYGNINFDEQNENWPGYLVQQIVDAKVVTIDTEKFTYK